jgi:hypothetical protein
LDEGLLSAIKSNRVFKWWSDLERLPLTVAFERVYTVWDYYDGERSGIAAFSGQPHRYECEWNASKQDYADTFVLTPIDQDTLALAMEQWSIWREWEDAFYRGEVPQSTHPGLPGSHGRYAQLEASLKARIPAKSAKQRRARGFFRSIPAQENAPPGMIRELEVEWTDVEA